MAYVVFTQVPDGRLDPAQLVAQARRFFEAEIEIVDAPLAAAVGGFGGEVRLRLHSPKHGYGAEFLVRSRACEAADFQAAQLAEARGRAAGMAALAERCGYLWQIEASDARALTHPSLASANASGLAETNALELSTLNLCALLASVGHGPVLPPDGSSLFGVRGAMQRVSKQLGLGGLER